MFVMHLPLAITTSPLYCLKTFEIAFSSELVACMYLADTSAVTPQTESSKSKLKHIYSFTFNIYAFYENKAKQLYINMFLNVRADAETSWETSLDELRSAEYDSSVVIDVILKSELHDMSFLTSPMKL